MSSLPNNVRLYFQSFWLIVNKILEGQKNNHPICSRGSETNWTRQSSSFWYKRSVRMLTCLLKILLMVGIGYSEWHVIGRKKPSFGFSLELSLGCSIPYQLFRDISILGPLTKATYYDLTCAYNEQCFWDPFSLIIITI